MIGFEVATVVHVTQSPIHDIIRSTFLMREQKKKGLKFVGRNTKNQNKKKPKPMFH